MTNLVTEFNQDNLMVITRMQYFQVENRIRTNSFLNLTRNALFSGDCFGNYHKDEHRYFLVNHYDGVKQRPEGGLTSSYKVDKELWAAFSAKYPKEALPE